MRKLSTGLMLCFVLLIMAFSFTSCGKIKVDANVPNTKHEVNHNIKFDAAISSFKTFCEDTYGLDTVKYDKCLDGILDAFKGVSQ